MTKDTPVPWEPVEFDYVRAGLADFVVEGLPIHTLWNLSYIAKTPEEFFAGIRAATELKDIVLDHYDKGDPDDGPFDEEDFPDWGDPEDDDFDEL